MGITAAELLAKRIEKSVDQYQERKKANDDIKVFSETSTLYAPAFTAHPTSPLSAEANDILKNQFRATKLLYRKAQLPDRQDITPQRKQEKLANIEKELGQIEQKYGLPVSIGSSGPFSAEAIQTYLEKISCIAEESFTPEEEVQLFLDTAYETIFTESNSILQKALETENMPLPRMFDVRSWCGGDADGNKNVTPAATVQALQMHYTKTAELYLTQITDTFDLPDIDKETKKGLQEVVAALQTLADSNRQQLTSTKPTQQVLTSFLNDMARKPVHTKAANFLLEKLKNFPLTGPKIDVRQSSEVNDAFLNFLLVKDVLPKDFIKSLGGKDALIKGLSGSGNRITKDFLIAFSNNSAAKKAVIQAYKNACLVHKSATPASPDAAPAEWRELERMIVAQDNPLSIDRYRVSDGRVGNDIRALRIFENIAQQFLGLDKEHKQTDFIILAETEEDVKRLPETTADILESGLNLDNQITLFPGYSDAEKRMGLTGLITITQSLQKTFDVIKQHSTSTSITVSHGGGEDITRLGGKYKADATIQGRAGTDLSVGDFKTTYYATQHATDAVYQQADEVREMSRNPEAVKQLDQFRENGLCRFREMVSPHTEEINDQKTSGGLGLLTSALLGGDFYKLVKSGNKSSRAAAKVQTAAAVVTPTATPTSTGTSLFPDSMTKSMNKTDKGFFEAMRPHAAFDTDKERAIGSASLFTASGTGAQVLMGLPSYDEVKAAGCDKIKDLSVIKDIAYKGLYTAAITDFSRAYAIAGIDTTQAPQGRDHSASDIKQAVIQTGDAQTGKKMLLEKMHYQAVEAARGMALVLTGETGVARLDTHLQTQPTLAKAVQAFLKEQSGDTHLSTLGQEATHLTQHTGQALTSLLSGNIEELLETDTPLKKQNNHATLILIREEQTVPDILKNFGAVTR